MSSHGLPVEKLRQYLRELKPGARALLIAELERGLRRGDDLPAVDMVLQELRRSIQETGARSPRIGDPARLFFQPIEPFLVDDAANHNHRGRIARVSLEPIWAWIIRDVAPAEAKTFAEDVARALLDNDAARCENLAHGFQARVVQCIQDALAAAANDDKTRRRLAAQVGTPRALEDVQALLAILKARDALASIGLRLPGHIRNLADGELQSVKALLDTAVGRNRENFLYALLMVMSRLASPWQLVRLATKAAESDVAARVAESPYGIAVGIVINEIERMVNELRADLRAGRGIAVTALLRSIHEAVRGMRTELDLAVDSSWGRQLAAIRTDISNLLKSEVESMPGRVRRLLRPRAAAEIAPGAVLDASDVAEAESLIEFVATCRHYADELAVNEMTMRLYTELQQYLETSAQALIESLRLIGPAEWAYRQSQVEAAIRFCAKVFGQDYAATLAKAAEVAAHHAAAEGNAAKGPTAA